MSDPFGTLPRVAYFSMEIALDAAMHSYSGGLGVLAGDVMRSAADLAVPLVGVTLVSRLGYFRQRVVDGMQVEAADPWEPQRFARRLDAKVRLRIDGRDVWIAAWEHNVEGHCESGQPVPVLLLDTDLQENHPDDRILTDALYGGDDAYRLRQEMVLGVGGVRMLHALGIQVRKFHLNEGHAAFLTLELLRTMKSEDAVQDLCIFTTHTPVAAGHDQFDYPMAMRLLGDLVPERTLRSLAGAARLNMTQLALSLSGWVNGVAQRHAETSRLLFPGYTIHAITNGVHPWTWASDGMRALFDRYIPHWCHEPELLVHVDRIPAQELVAAHAAARQLLLAHAAQSAPGRLRPDRFTIGFARRMTAYKRPHLLFTDLERLRRIARHHPFQVVLAGKAHPRDFEGRRQIERLHAWARELEDEIPIVFLPDYGMDIARLLVAGVDLWLNTPQRPLEASGTSGMKAAINGVPSLSVLDGWWLEGCDEGVTGWAIGTDGPNGPHDSAADAQSLYAKLEDAVLPLFHEQPARWVEVMRGAIGRNGAYFSSHRMLRRYVLEAYSR